MALAPQQISSGAGFDEPAPLTPGQRQTVDQLVAAGATTLPQAERPQSDTRSIPAGVPSIDAQGLVRVGAYEPTASFEDEYAARLGARDDAAWNAETAALESEIVEIETAAGQGAGPRTANLRDQPLTADEYVGQLAVVGGAFGDFARGTIVEGLPAMVSGAKGYINETLDFIDFAGDSIEKFVPATIAWGPDGIELTTQDKAAEKQGKNPLFGFRFNDATKDKLETNTGNFIRSGSQFVAGFLGAGKILKGWSAATKAGKVGKAMAQGAIADFTAFDPHEERLSNFLSDLDPDKRVPFLDFLAADKEDSEIVGRAKNAVEGLGLGVATDAVLTSLRAIRAGRQAKAAVRQQAAAEGLQIDPLMPPEQLAAEADAEVAKVMALLKPNFGRKVDAAARSAAPVKPGEVTGATIEPNVFDIDFSKIETADDVKGVISTMLERNVDQVDAARGGTQSWATTREKAEGLDWVGSMAARRQGQAMNAGEITAYRGALNSSATKLLALARNVQDAPSTAAQFAFRRQMAIHNAIQLEFMGARAEAGRALQAFQMPVGTPARQLREIDVLIAEHGGTGTSQELADKVLKAARKGDKTLNEVARMGVNARSRAMVKTIYTNGLLSGLGTPIVNAAGNSVAMVMNLTDRFASPRWARAMGEEPVTEVGEAGALITGYMGAIRDAFRMPLTDALKEITPDAIRQQGVFRAMAPGLDNAMPDGIVKTGREESGGLTYEDAVTSKPLGAAAWRVDQDSNFGRALDVLQAAVEAPSNINSLMDDFFRVVSARGELRAQAFRQVQKDIRAGTVDKADAQAAIARLVDNPTKAMLDSAEREMRELTFTRADGEFERKVNAFRTMLDSHGPVPLGTMLMPFVRTPANIMSYAIRHSPLAPFSARLRSDMAEGGARGEIAMAQWATGTAAYALLMDMAMNGEITGGGPGNKAQREAMMRADANGNVNWQPYSMRVGDRWVSYERLDPLGTAMSLAADFSEILSNEDWDTGRAEQPTEIVGHVVGALGEAFFDKTMLRSLFDTVKAVTSGDQAQVETMLKERAVGVIPFSSASRMFRRGSDEYMRETSGVLDNIKNTIPGLSNSLPPARDLWGQERTYQTGLGVGYDMIVPLRTRGAGSNTIDLEILDQGITVSMPARSLTVETDEGGERVSLRNRLDVYSDYVGLAGQPAFEQLEAVVTGNHEDSEFYYSLSDGPDGGKADYIKSVIKAHREEAKATIMELYGDDLARLAKEQKRNREAARD
jgi:peptidoglycan hydrolase-like protein with peptidoglycan-binding domain